MSTTAAESAAALSLLCACSAQTYQSAFGGGAVENLQFQILGWIFLAVCAVMYLLVIAFLVAGIVRRRRGSAVEARTHEPSQPGMRRLLIGWAALIGGGLTALTIASFLTDRSMAEPAARPQLSITVTANQYWWDVEYNSPDPSQVVHTANELVLPAGAAARITLHSNDVIHSLWVPSLAGKEDLIPGRETALTVTPEKTGIFRGQCAEFCGHQHAHMALTVEVVSPSDFVKWRERQAQPASPPRTALALAGYTYVTTHKCAECHAIAGTRANGQSGPDLTHLASRRSIAAGTLPMDEGNLYGWVANPQALKPGTSMPALGLEPEQLHAVVAYLETLK